MIEAVIVDDEEKSRQVLKHLLKGHPVKITGEAASINEACKMIEALQPQLVFLDIRMPMGDGFQLLQKFERVNFEVIFITSYNEYAIQAIRFSALDYLLKPVETQELNRAIGKAIRKITSGQTSQFHFVNLLHSINEDVEKRVGLHIHDAVRFYNASEISHIEAQGPYSFVYTTEGEKIITSKTLKEFEEFFRVQDCFVRITRGCIVHVNAIRSYSKGEDFTILLKTGQEFEVSRRRKAEVLSRLHRHHSL